jgi:hypothetical protein
LEEAFAQAKKNGEYGFIAEMYRVKGDLTWFTEGFDTADLKDAKALVVILSEDV